jgi:hypothetical protein
MRGPALPTFPNPLHACSATTPNPADSPTVASPCPLFGKSRLKAPGLRLDDDRNFDGLKLRSQAQVNVKSARKTRMRFAQLNTATTPNSTEHPP